MVSTCQGCKNEAILPTDFINMIHVQHGLGGGLLETVRVVFEEPEQPQHGNVLSFMPIPHSPWTQLLSLWLQAWECHLIALEILDAGVHPRRHFSLKISTVSWGLPRVHLKFLLFKLSQYL